MKSLVCHECRKETGLALPIELSTKVECAACALPLTLPTKYEQQQAKEIHVFKCPQLGFFDWASGWVNWPLEQLYEAIKSIPYAEVAIQKSVGGFVNLLNDGAQSLVRQDAILQDFDGCGLRVEGLDDVQFLDLRDVDRAIGFLAAKYKTIAFTEGGLAGLPANAGPEAAVPAIVADTIFILGLNLRAIGEYATYCGFDIKLQHERLFALNILALASAPTDAAKQVTMAQLVRIATEVAKRRPWRELEEKVLVRIVQKIAETLGQRLTKAKLAQLLPVLSAGVGAGFNAYFTAKVTEAAYYLYRERFLAAKYGPDIIERTVPPADDFE